MFAALFVLFNTVVMAVDGYKVHRSPHILPNTAVFDDTIKCMPATTYYVLSLMSIVPIAAFISTLITSQLYGRNLLSIIGAPFRPNVSDEDEESEPESEPEPEETPDEKYVKLYPIKRATHDDKVSTDELKYSIIIEGTPRGILVMCYNTELDGFEYWTDSDIPLTMLETASRRYVTEYNCKKFYLPRKKTNETDKEDTPAQPQKVETTETPQQEEPTTPQQEEPTTPDTDSEDDVFIKRKKTDAQLKLEKQIAEEEPVTRFIRRGKLLDFKPKDLFKDMNLDERVVKKTLNYDIFKKAMEESMAAPPSKDSYASIRDACDSGRF